MDHNRSQIKLPLFCNLGHRKRSLNGSTVEKKQRLVFAPAGCGSQYWQPTTQMFFQEKGMKVWVGRWLKGHTEAALKMYFDLLEGFKSNRKWWYFWMTHRVRILSFSLRQSMMVLMALKAKKRIRSRKGRRRQSGFAKKRKTFKPNEVEQTHFKTGFRSKVEAFVKHSTASGSSQETWRPKF